MKIKTKTTKVTQKQFKEIYREEMSNAIKRGKAYAKKMREINIKIKIRP